MTNLSALNPGNTSWVEEHGLFKAPSFLQRFFPKRFFYKIMQDNFGTVDCKNLQIVPLNEELSNPLIDAWKEDFDVVECPFVIFEFKNPKATLDFLLKLDQNCGCNGKYTRFKNETALKNGFKGRMIVVYRQAVASPAELIEAVAPNPPYPAFVKRPVYAPYAPFENMKEACGISYEELMGLKPRKRN